MTNSAPTNADDSTESAENQPRSADERTKPTPALTAVVTETDRGPDECTIYPRGASDETLVTTWMTAEEGSYVALDEMR